MAIKFLSGLSERRARKRRCIAGGYLEGMPIPARSIPTRVGGNSLSTGTSTELHTHGQEAALLAPTLIRGGPDATREMLRFFLEHSLPPAGHVRSPNFETRTD